MRARVQVLSVERKAGRSKQGNDYQLDICQCVVHGQDDDGKERVQVGELVLPKNHPNVTPGMYDAEFGISVGQDKRIGGRLLQLYPVAAAAAKASASAAPAKV